MHVNKPRLAKRVLDQVLDHLSFAHPRRIMASTVEEALYLHESVIWGHHVTVWNPVLGEVNCLALEKGNEYDRFAVCVKRDEIIGHVPRQLSREVWHFLRHGGRSICEIIGRTKRGNRLEVPCRYRSVAKRRLIKKLEGLLQN